jgi:hypothetical protein
MLQHVASDVADASEPPHSTVCNRHIAAQPNMIIKVIDQVLETECTRSRNAGSVRHRSARRAVAYNVYSHNSRKINDNTTSNRKRIEYRRILMTIAFRRSLCSPSIATISATTTFHCIHEHRSRLKKSHSHAPATLQSPHPPPSPPPPPLLRRCASTPPLAPTPHVAVHGPAQIQATIN